MSSLDDAIRQMLAAGMPDFPSPHPIIDGRIHRYGPKSKGAYKLYEFRAHTGQYVVGGWYRLFGEIDVTKIDIDWKGINQEERERHARERAVTEARERNKEAERSKDAASRGRQQWNNGRSAKPQNVETYLDRKGLTHTKGLRYFADGTLLVPMIRYDITEAQEQVEGYTGPRRFVGLQKISPDGKKLFNKGLALTGAACRLGAAPKMGELILLTEGLATGLSLRMGVNEALAVYVAFFAGNLLPVAKILRKIYPNNPVLICADDDAYLEASMVKLLRENWGVTDKVSVPMTNWPFKGTVLQDGVRVPADLLVSCEGVVDGEGVPGVIGSVQHGERLHTFTRENAGRKYALRAAAEIGNAEVIYPAFAERNIRGEAEGQKLTDYNDLHQVEGLESLRKLLAPELERLKLNAHLQALVRAELGKRKGTGGVPRPEKGGGGDKPPTPDRDDDYWSRFYKRYTLIYPSDTLWDAERREIVKLQHVRIAHTDWVVNTWLASPRRRLVDIEKIVFEPGQDVAPPGINLFRGLSMKPSDTGSCEKLLALLRYLCGEEELHNTPISDWVLKWLAYPLQHPGAKMETALVFHGTEGAGKNKFFGQIKRIYGEYGTLITQSELEDKFNGWLSRRLFIIANEVISRAELRHHVGKLKNYVTESPLPIRDMWSPVRYETNHAQFVFLTNEVQALFMGPDDRRYMVIWTPPMLSREYYEAVDEEIAQGGVEALLSHLLKLPLGDFNEYTKPPMTEAKELLIEQGLSSVQMFQRWLHEGLLHPLTYSTCLVEDLYRAYQRFCARTGERNPRSLPKFSPEFMRLNGVRRSIKDIDKSVKLVGTKERRIQGTMMFMGDDRDELAGDGEGVIGKRKQAIAEWKGKLKEYLDQNDLGLQDDSGSRRSSSGEQR